MRGFVLVMAAIAVIALGFWAYQQNYHTQAAVQSVRSLQEQIGAAHSRLNMLRAEWAYLNRPDRLRDLADLNFDRLGLLPMMPEAFGEVEQIMYPLRPLLPISDVIDVVGQLPASEEPL